MTVELGWLVGILMGVIGIISYIKSLKKDDYKRGTQDGKSEAIWQNISNKVDEIWSDNKATSKIITTHDTKIKSLEERSNNHEERIENIERKDRNLI